MGKSKEHKKANVKPFMVKNYLSVFVNCMIENPAFDSQVYEPPPPHPPLGLPGVLTCMQNPTVAAIDHPVLLHSLRWASLN